MGLRQRLLEDLIRWAEERAMSATELATELNVSPQTLSNWKARGEISKDALEQVIARFPFELPNRPNRLLKVIEDQFWIPLFNVSASMGTGALPPEHIEVVRQISLDINALRKLATFSGPQNLSFLSAIGTSMEPTFSDGDVLLIDGGVNEIRYEAVYVLERQGELFVKRLQRLPDGALLMISDNPLYKPIPVAVEELDQFQVRGRVVLALNAKKL